MEMLRIRIRARSCVIKESKSRLELTFTRYVALFGQTARFFNRFEFHIKVDRLVKVFLKFLEVAFQLATDFRGVEIDTDLR